MKSLLYVFLATNSDGFKVVLTAWVMIHKFHTPALAGQSLNFNRERISPSV
ncbi:MAG: hypothetical protein H7318_10595 [Oligoflexus sp.]|nr:hypothetical protein [Oligoflexus sp.]